MSKKMVYRYPSINKITNELSGTVRIDNKYKCDYLVVDEDCPSGYYETSTEAIAGVSEEKSEYRMKLEARAKELDIKFPKNILDETLYNKIKEAAEK